MVLQEGEAGAGLQVRGIDHDQRAVAAQQVAESRALEDRGVVQRCRRRGAAFGGEPAQRVEDALHDVAGQVAAQEPGFEIAEGVLAMQAVIGRGETAAGHRADRIDFVQQATPAVRADAGVAQFLQHPVGQRRGARPATGERQHQGDVVAAAVLDRSIHRITRRGCRARAERPVLDAGEGRAADQQRQQQQRAKRRQYASGPHRRQSSTRQNTAFR